MSLAIEVKNFIKSYGDNTVIKGISFSVEKGEIFALLGTNGAGKTTTLECLEGLRKYDGGTVKVDGKIGVQLQSSSLPANIRPYEAVSLFSRWNRVAVDHEALQSFGLDEFKNRQYRELSTGQKRRLHLALALIGNPEVIFLDEPTAGLDVEGRAALHSEIRKLKQQGRTIIMASHDMAEVESLCDRIAILKNGNIAFQGTANQLTLEVGGTTRVYLKTASPISVEKFGDCEFQGEEQGYSIYITGNIGDGLIELLTAAKKQGVAVIDIKIERTTLEQKFIDIAKEAVS